MPEATGRTINLGYYDGDITPLCVMQFEFALKKAFGVSILRLPLCIRELALAFSTQLRCPTQLMMCLEPFIMMTLTWCWSCLPNKDGGVPVDLGLNFSSVCRGCYQRRVLAYDSLFWGTKRDSLSFQHVTFSNRHTPDVVIKTKGGVRRVLSSFGARTHPHFRSLAALRLSERKLPPRYEKLLNYKCCFRLVCDHPREGLERVCMDCFKDCDRELPLASLERHQVAANLIEQAE